MANTIDVITPAWTNLAAQVWRCGYRIKALNNCFLYGVTKHSDCTATRCLIYTSTGVLITTSTFIGDVASFNYHLIKYTEYYIEVDNSGAAYNVKYLIGDTSLFYPVVGTNISYLIAGYNEGDEVNRAFNIINIITAPFAVTKSSRYLKTSWDELTASDSTKAIGHVQSLVAEQSFIPSRYMIGL